MSHSVHGSTSVHALEAIQAVLHIAQNLIISQAKPTAHATILAMYSVSQMQCLATKLADILFLQPILFTVHYTRRIGKICIQQLHETCFGTYSNNGKNLFYVLSSTEEELTVHALNSCMKLALVRQND